MFFSDRSSAFFAFESNREVKTAVRRLPKVGIGTAYDFAQTRFVRLLAYNIIVNTKIIVDLAIVAWTAENINEISFGDIFFVNESI